MGKDSEPKRACAAFEETLVLYYYSDCSVSEAERVEVHLKECIGCTAFLDDLRAMLPLTVVETEPPKDFWERYSREIHQRLVRLAAKPHWWKNLSPAMGSWRTPALASAALLLLGLALVLTQGLWRSETRKVPPGDEAVLEILPIAENLEFFSLMEFLDSMDSSEPLGAAGNGFV